jgi:glucan phosphoethanolaminetransferase (alkaline phosphatase superfamily)
MFDLINGLPVHALVVHAVVILLPLLSLVTVAFVVRPRWRRELPWAILGNAAALAASYVAKLSGEKLQIRLSVQAGHEVAGWHEHLGSVLWYFALAQLVASIIAWVLIRQRSPRGQASKPLVAIALVLVLAAGGAATVWTYRVGDSGAQAVWKDTIANTKTP